MTSFETWWYREGSASPVEGEDCEEHMYRIAKIAWANGAYKSERDIPNEMDVQTELIEAGIQFDKCRDALASDILEDVVRYLRKDT